MADNYQNAVSTLSKVIVDTVQKAMQTTTVSAAKKLQNITITGENILPASIGNAHIREGSIDIGKIHDLTAEVARISAAEIQHATIDTAQIKDLSAGVITALNANVGSLNASTINTRELEASVVSTMVAKMEYAFTEISKTDLASIATAVIQNLIAGSITAEQIAAGAITSDKISTEGLEADVIKTGTLDGTNLTVKNLKLNSLEAGTINGMIITPDTIPYNALGDSVTSVVEGKTTNYYSATAPVQDEQKPFSIGDTWYQIKDVQYESPDGTTRTQQVTTQYEWNGTEWAQKKYGTDALGDQVITEDSLAPNSVSSRALQVNSVTANAIAAGTITASEIKSGSINTACLEAGCVDATIIKAGSIVIESEPTSESKVIIQDGAIKTDHLAASVITADKIKAGELVVKSEHDESSDAAVIIKDKTITAPMISSGAIFSDSIVAEAITSDKLNVDEILVQSGVFVGKIKPEFLDNKGNFIAAIGAASTGDVVNVTDRVDIVEEELANLELYQSGISQYITMTPDRGLIIGELSDGEPTGYYTNMTGTELGFYNGDTKVAYISGEQLYIGKAQLTDQLTMGDLNGQSWCRFVVSPDHVKLVGRAMPGGTDIYTTLY